MIEWEDRFWANVEKTDGCWIWRGALNKINGAGQFGHDTRKYAAHRVSYELHFGRIPDRTTVRQSCGNKLCVRPQHLKLGGNGVQLTPPNQWTITHGEWTKDAVCGNYNPDLWNGDYVSQTVLAKRICKLCPIATKNACLQEAIETGDKWTVRGGMTAEERDRLRKAS